MYKIAVQAVNGHLITVPLKRDTYDLPALAAAVDDRTKLIFIANPNNPTGTYVDRTSVTEFLSNVPHRILVVFDQAYLEYVEEADYPDAQDFLEDHPNLIVLRTFSKVYGLAGIRIGYAVAAPHIIELLNKVRSPFNTNSLSQVAAIAALDDHDHVQRSIEGNRAECLFLTEGLTELGVSFVPSVTNFCLVTTPIDAQRLFRTLLERGVIVRPMGAYNLPYSIRVTFGRHDENLRFLETLSDVLTELNGRKNG